MKVISIEYSIIKIEEGEMKERNKSKMPFFLAYQHDNTIIPSDFTITSLLPIKPKGIFETSFFLDYMFACGTQEGPIFLAGFDNKNKKLQLISILNGHSYPITDIQESLHGDKFISISSDSTLCIWSIYDASCIIQSHLSLKKGEYNISICSTDPTVIWIWAVGQSIYGYNIETKEIMYCMPVDGLRSLSAVSHLSSSVSDSVVLAFTVSKLISFTIGHDSTLEYQNEWEAPDPLNFYIFVSQRGIIFYSKTNGTWSIIRLPKLDSVVADNFELEPDDNIFGVDWHENNTICFASYKCRFLLVKLKRLVDTSRKKSKLTISSKTFLSYDSFLTSFSFLSDDSVVFVPTNKHSAVILSDKDCLILREKPTRYQFDVIDSDYGRPCVVYADRKSMLSFYNVRTHTSSAQRYQFEGKITSIFARNASITNFLQIVCGFEDGRVAFWTIGTEPSASTFAYALDSAILTFAEPPLKLSGRQALLAIGQGSCCLFKSNEIHLKYNLDLAFRIEAIYFIKQSLLFVFQLSNGTYAVYNTTQPNSIDNLTFLPLNATLIYSYCSSSRIDGVSSLACNKIGNRTIWYQLFNIVKLHETENNDEKKQCAIEMLNNIWMDMNDHQGKNNSFVIMGHHNVATLFYSPYSLNFSNYLNASPSVAAYFYIIKHLIHGMINKTHEALDEENESKAVNFLPVMTKILYKSDDLEVQKICANTCTSLSSCITFNQSQVFVSPFVQNERYKNSRPFEKHELLLMSMLTSRYSHVLPDELFPNLYGFLRSQQSLSDSYHPNAHAAMATFVLIDGITNWLKFIKSNGKKLVMSSSFSEMDESLMANPKNKRKGKADQNESIKALFISIMKSVLINQKAFPFLYDRFLRYVYSEDMMVFVDILPDFLRKVFPASHHHQSISLSEVKNLTSLSNSLIGPSVNDNESEFHHIAGRLGHLALNLYSEIELKNPKVAWGRLSSAIALNGTLFPEYAKTAQLLIEKHAKLLSYVDMKENAILIGTMYGDIHAITGAKKNIHENLFSEGINFVSIGPSLKYGLAISNADLTCKIFQIKPSFKLVQSLRIETPPKNMMFSVRWLHDDNATIYFVDSTK